MTKPVWTDLTLTEQSRLADLYEQGRKVELQKEAAKYGWQPESLERQIRFFLYYKRQFAGIAVASFPMPDVPRYTEFGVIEADDAIVISDLEVPDVDPYMLELALLTGQRHNIKRLIIAGDFLATDQQALNDWVNVFTDGREMTYKNALNMGMGILKMFFNQFEHIHIIQGNHDDRIARKTGGMVDLGMFLENTGVNYSQYGYMYLMTKRGPVYICHPQNFSANSANLGQKLYNVTASPMGEKCHVVLGHTHQAQTGFSPDGLREIIALGCMRDPEKTKYKALASNTYPQWSQGFLMIKDGFFHPLTRRGTDWIMKGSPLHSPSRPAGSAH